MPPLWQFDQDLFKAIHVGLRREWLDPVMRGLSYSGLGYIQAVPLIVAAFFTGWQTQWKVLFALAIATVALFVELNGIAFAACLLLSGAWLFLDRATARCSLAALVTSGLVRVVIAQSVTRQRPSVLPFATPLEHVTAASSFPSGHTTTTFAIAAVMCWRLARTEYAGLAWIALAWGALVAFSRVYVGVHYPLDAFGGAILGVAFGSFCYWWFSVKGWFNQEAKAPIDLKRS